MTKKIQSHITINIFSRVQGHRMRFKQLHKNYDKRSLFNLMTFKNVHLEGHLNKVFLVIFSHIDVTNHGQGET